MPEAVPCESKQYHMGHAYSTVLKRRCTGLTSCGLYQHQPHEFDRIDRVWCPGICDCGMDRIYGGTHGPGEHK